MAQLGVEAVVDFAKGGTKPSGYTDTGVTLITDKPQPASTPKTRRSGSPIAGANHSGDNADKARAECPARTSARAGVSMAAASPMEPAAWSADAARGRACFDPGLIRSLGPLLALLLAAAYFTSRTDRFLTGPNLSLVVQQSMVVGVLAIGQTLIILTAGIDLSCGAVMALGGIVMTREVVNHGVNPYLSILIGFGVCVGSACSTAC